MGADVHSLAEIKHENGWEAVTGDLFPNVYYSDRYPLDDWNKPLTKRPLAGRNYDLFALLADVRNGSQIVPIAPLKGVPEDASTAWLVECEAWGLDFHSPTWYTLAELEAAVWEQPVTRSGVVSEAAYLAYRDNGTEPDTWSGRVGGGGVRTVTIEEYEAGERGDPWPEDQVPNAFWGASNTFVQLVWPSVVSMKTNEVTSALNIMAELAPDGDHNAIRIVMAFDN